MNTIKIKRNWLVYNNNLPFIILGFIVFANHISLNFCNDDIRIFNSTESLWNTITYYYQNWSSRIIISVFGFIMCKSNIWLWRICDTAVFVLLAYLLSFLLINKNKRTGNWLVCGLLLLYPFSEMNSAGWVTTTVTYMWPLSFGCLAMVPIKKHLQSNILKWYEYIIYTIALLIASNHEEMAIIIITVYLFFTVYFFYCFKSINIFLVVQLIIALSSLLFILTCPGNFNRLNDEISNWMNEFLMYSNVDKFTAGFMTTSLKYIGTKENTLFIIELLLCIQMFRTNKNALFLIIACIPLVVKFLFGFLIDNTYFEWLRDPNTILPGLTNEAYDFPLLYNEFKPAVFPGLTEGVYDVITPANYLKLNVYLSIVLSIIVIGCILISLFILIENYKHFVFISIVLGVAFLSRIVIGFSPTLYASHQRTFIFFHFSLVALCIYILDTFFMKKQYSKHT